MKLQTTTDRYKITIGPNAGSGIIYTYVYNYRVRVNSGILCARCTMGWDSVAEQDFFLNVKMAQMFNNKS